MLLVMALLALPPPSPGGALLDDLWLRERLLLAESPAPDAEQDLEQDMESARRRLGHGEAPAPQAKPDAKADTAPRPDAKADTAPRPDANADSTPRPDVKTDANADPPRAVRRPTESRPRAGDDGAPRRRDSRRRAPGVTLGGHGKAYYLVWGLVDWGVAGGLWVGGTYASLMSLVLVSAWDDENLSTRERRDVRSGAVISAGVAAGLTVGGIILARRAGRNVGAFQDLRDAGRAGFTGELPPHERDDEED